MSTTSQEQLEHDNRWHDTGYSADHAGYTPHFLKFMDRWKRDKREAARALDVGCGDGFFSKALDERGYTVTGLDLSDVALRRARSTCPSATFLSQDTSQRFPFDDRTFDLAWCSEHLEHLFSPLATVKEIARVLKPGGAVLITVPYHGLIKNVGIALFAFDRHYDPNYPHIRFFTRNTLSAIVGSAGLEVVEVTTCGSGFGVRDLLAPTNILLHARRPART